MSIDRRKLYLDSSVLGFALSKHDTARRAEANRFLRQVRDGQFIGGYSFVTQEEVAAAPPRVAMRLGRKIEWAQLVRVNVRSRSRVYDLADEYCRASAIPRESFNDALHVAVASLWRADALVSYNFAHIVRLETMVRVNAVNRRQRLAELFLCQPSEVMQR